MSGSAPRPPWDTPRFRLLLEEAVSIELRTVRHNGPDPEKHGFTVRQRIVDAVLRLLREGSAAEAVDTGSVK